MHIPSFQVRRKAGSRTNRQVSSNELPATNTLSSNKGFLQSNSLRALNAGYTGQLYYRTINIELRTQFINISLILINGGIVDFPPVEKGDLQLTGCR